jgi:hypothetical protein
MVTALWKYVVLGMFLGSWMTASLIKYDIRFLDEVLWSTTHMIFILIGVVLYTLGEFLSPDLKEWWNQRHRTNNG